MSPQRVVKRGIRLGMPARQIVIGDVVRKMEHYN